MVPKVVTGDWRPWGDYPGTEQHHYTHHSEWRVLPESHSGNLTTLLIIRPSSWSFSSPLHMVPKKVTGDWHPWGDYPGIEQQHHYTRQVSYTDFSILLHGTWRWILFGHTTRLQSNQNTYPRWLLSPRLDKWQEKWQFFFTPQYCKEQKLFYKWYNEEYIVIYHCRRVSALARCYSERT